MARNGLRCPHQTPQGQSRGCAEDPREPRLRVHASDTGRQTVSEGGFRTLRVSRAQARGLAGGCAERLLASDHLPELGPGPSRELLGQSPRSGGCRA